MMTKATQIIAVMASVGACSGIPGKADVVFDLHFEGTAACHYEVGLILKSMGLRLRSNAPVSNDRLSSEIYGPANLDVAQRALRRLEKMHCVKKLQIKASRRGDLFPDA